MKKLFLSFCVLFLFTLLLNAQPTLFGTTGSGGASGNGVIFRYDRTTNVYSKIYDFTGQDGAVPEFGFVQASDGLVYGTTSLGGAAGAGVLYSFNPVTSTVTKLFDFSNEEGFRPNTGLIQASNGLLYGGTNTGGNQGAGVLFSFNPLTSTYSRIHSFTGADGRSPEGPLFQATNGVLYGMAEQGGSADKGVIFSFDPKTNSYAKLYDFTGANGDSPLGGLIQAPNGLLYGATFMGGSTNAGTIFSFDPATNAFSKLIDFNVTNGENPSGGLLYAANGLIYGTTQYGGSASRGIIFVFDPVTKVVSTLYNFVSGDGYYSRTYLTQASDGRLYGTTDFGGSSNIGVVFSFDPATNTYNKLHDFNGADGKQPNYSRLLELKAKAVCTPPTFLNDASIVLDASKCGNDGNISIIPKSGTAPFVYSIDGGATYVTGPNNGYTFQGLAAGTYQLRLKDANSCESAIVIREVKTVYECPACTPPTFLNNPSIVLDASCNGGDGNITIIPTSGTGPFMYSIDGGATYVAGPNGGYTFQNLAAGTYMLRLKAGNGCQSAVVTKVVKANAYGPCVVSVVNPRLRSSVLEATANMRAYPNPSKGQFKVQLNGFASARVQVSILDAKGSVLQTRNLNAGEGNTVAVNLTGKTKGLYFVRVVSEKGVQVQKVMVQ